MPLTAGAHLGPYEILAALGAGGMGEVYRAHDTKLNRDVALKILPEAFTVDVDRIARFRREAQVLASLNHPNIAAIYGFEDSGETHALVLELVEGPTLADRIAKGPIPLDEAIPIAKQIADALEAAHERGIIHRDLKPANLKVRPDGTVKVLDFGLAKAFDPVAPTVGNATMSPTLSIHATQAGVILGTAAYMAPEQVRGTSVDRRADIWAFGVVLFEMLVGRRPFDGATISDMLAKVIEREPDWMALPPATPGRLRELVRQCLRKDPKARLRDIGDARVRIDELLSGVPEDSVMERRAPAPAWRRLLPWAVAGLLLAGLAADAVVHLRETPAEEMRVEITTPSTAAPLEFALSPDGKSLVFVASGDGPQRLWLRALSQTEAQPMAGTEGAEYPFWSADSRAIAFTADQKLKRIDVAGGPPQTLVSPSFAQGGAWNTAGTILFTPGVGTPLFRVAASGGPPVAVTQLIAGQAVHNFPQFLPDGRHFLFYALGAPEVSGVYLGSLDDGPPTRLAAADAGAVPLAPGMIALLRGQTLLAQRLDISRAMLVGETVRVADPVGRTPGGAIGVSTAANGRLAYRGGAQGQRQLRWYDRTGHRASAEPDETSSVLYPEISPDGTQVAVGRAVDGNQDVWLRDLVRGGWTRLTTELAIDGAPVWSPDSKRIAFFSNRRGRNDLYVRPSNLAGGDELLLATPNGKWPQDWSRDGRFLLYGERDPHTGRDLWALPMTGTNRKPVVIANTPFLERNGQFSPDGHSVAYETNASGRFEVVVQAFPVPTGKWPVSTAGGIQPRWRADGKELYFLAPDGKLMVVSIAVGATVTVGTPVALFAAGVSTGGAADKQQYAVSSDGRFLINQPADPATPPPITVLLNWRPPTKQ